MHGYYVMQDHLSYFLRCQLLIELWSTLVYGCGLISMLGAVIGHLETELSKTGKYFPCFLQGWLQKILVGGLDAIIVIGTQYSRARSDVRRTNLLCKKRKFSSRWGGCIPPSPPWSHP